MKNIFIIIALLMAYNSFSQSDTDHAKNQFNTAAHLYETGEFNTAIEQWEIVSNNFHSVELSFNLGNAYFKTNQLGKAILNYERALKLAPYDEDIIANLQLANNQQIDKLEALPSFKIRLKTNHFLSSIGLPFWQWASILSFMFALVLGVLSFLLKKLSPKIALRLAVVCIIFGLVTHFSSQSLNNYLYQNNTAVITTEKVDAFSTPAVGNTPVFVIHEGLKVEITRIEKDWSKIKLSNGNKGWVKTSFLEKI